MTRHRPFMHGTPRLAMAIKALDLTGWIEIGDDFVTQMATRRRLLDERPDDVLAGLPGSEAGQRELLALLLEHLARHFPQHYRVETDAVRDLASGLVLARTGEQAAPLALTGRLVQEDFCLLQKRSSAYHLVAAVLCFPAHWRLHDKLGRPLVEIHAPVPGFAEQLGTPVDHLFDRLQTGRPVQRLNWSLVDTTDLYLPPAHRRAEVDITGRNAGDKLWLRVERQTLRRLPIAGDVVFGIRTHLTPLAEVAATREMALALAARLRAMPAAMAAYKNLARIKEPLLAFLEQRPERGQCPDVDVHSIKPG